MGSKRKIQLLRRGHLSEQSRDTSGQVVSGDTCIPVGCSPVSEGFVPTACTSVIVLDRRFNARLKVFQCRQGAVTDRNCAGDLVAIQVHVREAL